jgi:hypothetical protein
MNMWVCFNLEECAYYVEIMEDMPETVITENLKERIIQKEVECKEYPNHKILMRERQTPYWNKEDSELTFEPEDITWYLKDSTGNLMCIEIDDDYEGQMYDIKDTEFPGGEMQW